MEGDDRSAGQKIHDPASSEFHTSPKATTMKMAKRNLRRCFGVLASLLLASLALSPAVAEAAVVPQTATLKTSAADTLSPTAQQDHHRDYQRGYRAGYYAGSGDYGCYLHVPSVGGSRWYQSGYRAGYKAGWKNHHCVA
jgi:hypothetical protein